MSDEPAGTGRTEQISPSVIAVTAENPGPLTLDGTRTWVVGRDQLAVVDPGPDDPAHLDRIDAAIRGRPVVAVALTHSHGDHTAAATEAGERWAPLHASAETLARLGLPGVTLSDGDEIDLGNGRVLHALETPGHSGDHLAFLHLPERDLLTGDLVLGRGSSMVAYPDGSVGSYIASLARLAALRPARLLPGHGPVVAAAAEKLNEYATHRRQRTEQVRQALDAGADSMDDLLESVYGALPAGVRRAAELSLRAHLQHLHELGYESSVRRVGITDLK